MADPRNLRLAVLAAWGDARRIPSVRRTVLVIDDHPGFRRTARRLLQAEGFDVIAEAPDAATGIEAARMLEPDIALVDIYLPDSDGFELSERLADLATPPMVVLISSREQEEFEPLVERSFARGFVPKHELSRDALEELLE
jgi:DNA-binding NarL/FixJ family response regulator